jgi:hypothetical protein
MAECPGTRQPLINRRRSNHPKASAWKRLYGAGQCSICSKLVSSHADGTAVQHNQGRNP